MKFFITLTIFTFLFYSLIPLEESIAEENEYLLTKNALIIAKRVFSEKAKIKSYSHTILQKAMSKYKDCLTKQEYNNLYSDIKKFIERKSKVSEPQIKEILAYFSDKEIVEISNFFNSEAGIKHAELANAKSEMNEIFTKERLGLIKKVTDYKEAYKRNPINKVDISEKELKIADEFYDSKVGKKFKDFNFNKQIQKSQSLFNNKNFTNFLRNNQEDLDDLIRSKINEECRELK